MNLLFIRHEKIDENLFDLYIDRHTLELFRINIHSGIIEVFTFAGTWQTTDITDAFVKQFYAHISEDGTVYEPLRKPTGSELVELGLLDKIKKVREILMSRARENND